MRREEKRSEVKRRRGVSEINVLTPDKSEHQAEKGPAICGWLRVVTSGSERSDRLETDGQGRVELCIWVTLTAKKKNSFRNVCWLLLVMPECVKCSK